jgi:hypothetical protein
MSLIVIPPSLPFPKNTESSGSVERPGESGGWYGQPLAPAGGIGGIMLLTIVDEVLVP